MGRPRAAGEVYYLGRVRWVPGVDPPELRAFLEEFAGAEPERKQAILKAALVGGLEEGAAEAGQVEDAETRAVLAGLLGEF